MSLVINDNVGNIVVFLNQLDSIVLRVPFISLRMHALCIYPAVLKAFHPVLIIIVSLSQIFVGPWKER